MAKLDVNQRQLVVAMDHGRAMGAVAGLEDPGRVIESPDPARMVAALRHLIHADGSVDEALQVLG